MAGLLIENCNIEKIAKSGQCFRMQKQADGTWLVPSAGDICLATQEGDNVRIQSDGNVDYWMHYFDVSSDYKKFDELCEKTSDVTIKKAYAFGKGLRLLNQDFRECLISYIISQRKSVPAISSSIEKLCARTSERGVAEIEGRTVVYDKFPTFQELRSWYEADRLENMGLGYRAPYVYHAACDVEEGKCRIVDGMSYDECLFTLKRLYGVGDKVANCVLLYSLGFHNAFPIDVWIQRVLDTYYSYQEFPFREFEGYWGLLQLYLFYYVRNL